jgi:hypothetical protein
LKSHIWRDDSKKGLGVRLRNLIEMLTSTATFGLALSSLLTCTIARPQVLERRQESFASQINGTRVSNAPVALDVSINGGGRNATAPLLYGWMFEDINVRITPQTIKRVLTATAFRRWRDLRGDGCEQGFPGRDTWARQHQWL